MIDHDYAEDWVDPKGRYSKNRDTFKPYMLLKTLSGRTLNNRQKNSKLTLSRKKINEIWEKNKDVILFAQEIEKHRVYPD